MLLTFSVVLSFAMQLLEVEDVVEETPVVTAWLALSMFMLELLADVLMFASYRKETTGCVLKHDPAPSGPHR